LCTDGPVTSLVELSLAAEHRRGHGALYDSPNQGLLSVVDLAEHGVIGFADGLGVRRPRPLVADGALVGSVTGCSAF
jgi:hypothetical protein